MDRMIKHIVFLGCGLLIAGCTTLHTAASKGNVKAIERLVNEEANIDETDDNGKTPLMYAVILNQKESVMALLKAGADVNTQSDTGNTALHEAILQGNSKFCSLLLEKGASTKIRNKQGKTALELARDMHNQSFYDLLSSHDVPDKTSLIKHDKAITEAPLPCPIVDTIEPIPVIVQPAEIKPVEVKPIETQKVVLEQSPKPSISNEEATARLRKMIAGRETMGIRNFLHEFPNAIELIEDPMQRIRYVGPSGFRIIDIIENMGRGKMGESEVINQILSKNMPYKQFSSDEIKMLSRYGISNNIIDAMVKVTK